MKHAAQEQFVTKMMNAAFAGRQETWSMREYRSPQKLAMRYVTIFHDASSNESRWFSVVRSSLLKKNIFFTCHPSDESVKDHISHKIQHWKPDFTFVAVHPSIETKTPLDEMVHCMYFVIHFVLHEHSSVWRTSSYLIKTNMYGLNLKQYWENELKKFAANKSFFLIPRDKVYANHVKPTPLPSDSVINDNKNFDMTETRENPTITSTSGAVKVVRSSTGRACIYAYQVKDVYDIFAYDHEDRKLLTMANDKDEIYNIIKSSFIAPESHVLFPGLDKLETINKQLVERLRLARGYFAPELQLVVVELQQGPFDVYTTLMHVSDISYENMMSSTRAQSNEELKLFLEGSRSLERAVPMPSDIAFWVSRLVEKKDKLPIGSPITDQSDEVELSKAFNTISLYNMSFQPAAAEALFFLMLHKGDVDNAMKDMVAASNLASEDALQRMETNLQEFYTIFKSLIQDFDSLTRPVASVANDSSFIGRLVVDRGEPKGYVSSQKPLYTDRSIIVLSSDGVGRGKTQRHYLDLGEKITLVRFDGTGKEMTARQKRTLEMIMSTMDRHDTSDTTLQDFIDEEFNRSYQRIQYTRGTVTNPFKVRDFYYPGNTDQVVKLTYYANPVTKQGKGSFVTFADANITFPLDIGSTYALTK